MKIAVIGGHLSPSLALIEKLPKEVEVIYIGRKNTFEGDDSRSLEYSTITDHGIKFYPLTTGRLQRRFTKNSLITLSKVPLGFLSARKILKKENPDIVVGFGGYLSLAVCTAAKSLGIPVVIHEQTLEAGLANKIISKFADKICISFESSKKFFPNSKTILTGNPIRSEIQVRDAIARADLKIDGNLPVIYITGGSTGSHTINCAVESCIEVLLEEASVIHQTGDAREFNDYARLEQKKNTFPDEKKSRYRLQKFIMPKEVGFVMQNSALVVGRSGINTVSELLYLKKPALLIPLPFAQRNEQLKNAQMLREAGLAEILMQSELTGITLLEKITTMLENMKKYTIIKEFDQQNDPAHALWETIKDVAEKKNKPQKK